MSMHSLPPRNEDRIDHLRNWEPEVATRAQPTERFANRAARLTVPAADVDDIHQRGVEGHPLRILVMDEDLHHRSAMVEYLKEHGISVMSADNQCDIVYQLANLDFDLLVLDLSIQTDQDLPSLLELRSQFKLPLIVTARPQIPQSQRTEALELGADDCIAKPLGLRELVARIRAILRRSPRHYKERLQGGSLPRHCRFGGWEVDRRTRRLTSPHGVDVPLTKSEYALLAAFIDAPKVALSRDRLLQATRIHEDLCDRSIDVQILRLRRKLNINNTSQDIIRTVRRFGYMFVLPVEAVPVNKQSDGAKSSTDEA